MLPALLTPWGATVAWWGCVAVVVGLVAWAGVSWFLSDCDRQTWWASLRVPPHAFAGKVVWIIGASSGIGEALAYEVSKRGAIVVLSARRMDRLMAVHERCASEGAKDVLSLRCDVEAVDTHAAVTQAVLNKYGRIDFLVNNAGRSQRGLIESTPLTIDRQMMDINFFGILSITKAVLPTFMKQRSGHIVNTSSIAGKVGSPCSATYAATKHALQGYFDTLRMEMTEYNIKVTNVCPGPVVSEITQHAFSETVGQPVGTPQEESTSRVTAERCAFLMASGMWAALPELWIATQPILLFLYIAQYLPGLYYILAPRFGKRRVTAFRRGDRGYGSVQSVWKLLFDDAGAKGGSDTTSAAPAPVPTPTSAGAPSSGGGRRSGRASSGSRGPSDKRE